MNDRATYGRQFSELSTQARVRDYLAFWELGIAIAFVVDGMGRRALIGLTADETLEFLRLHTPVYDGDADATERDRHAVLRRKFDDAREKAFREYQEQRTLGAVKH